MSTFDLSSVITSFAPDDPVYRVRRPAPAVVAGVVQDVAETTTEIAATVQPASGAELRLLDEGYVDHEGLYVFTVDEVLTQNGPRGVPDKVVFKGITYTVLKCDDYSETGNYWRTTCVKDLR